MKTIEVKGKRFSEFISAEEIQNYVQKVADELNRDFEGKHPIIIGVLNGSFMFVADLMKKIKFDCDLSFVKLASYHGLQSTGQVNELVGLNEDLTDRDVIVVEDIIDTGKTLEFLLDIIKTHETRSVSIATLLLKPDVFKKKYPVHYVGSDIPNKFVIGYGLDFDGLARNYESIYQLADE